MNPTAPNKLWNHILIFLCAGEYVELVSFAVLAPTIGQLFFHNQPLYLQQTYTLSVFCLAYIVRPIGGYVIGWLADTFGRKYSLIITSLLGGIFSLMIGLLPIGYQISTILLIILRLCQGLTLSNESMITAIWLTENTRQPRKWIGYLIAMLAAATLCSYALIELIKFSMSTQDFTTWGWRVPFILSSALIGVSLWLRSSMPTSILPRQTRDHPQQHLVYFLVSLIIGCLVIGYMYLPRYMTGSNSSILYWGWMVSIVVALQCNRLAANLNNACVILCSCLVVCLLIRQNAYLFTTLYQIGLTCFVISSYQWMIRSLPTDKRARMSMWYSQLGMSGAAFALPALSFIEIHSIEVILGAVVIMAMTVYSNLTQAS